MDITKLLLRALAGTALLISTHSYAASIILRTGVDGANVVLAAGTLDPNWTISTDGGTNFTAAKVAFPAQICCGMETAANTAAWISDPSITAGSAATDWGVSNLVIVRRTFDLSGLDPASAQMNGIWRLADHTAGIFLNGNQIPDTVVAVTWDNDESFSLGLGSGFFVPGINALEFHGTSVNSLFDAVWFDGSVSALAVVPVPAALWLLGSALGGLGFARRRIA